MGTATTYRVNITPDPSLLPKSGQVNYTIPDALGELVDNAVDARIAGELETVSVYIGQKDGGKMEIEDDGSGMGAEGLGNAWRMGFSAKDGDSIGKFGLGLKTATTNLGRHVEVVTTRAEDPQAYRVAYDEEAFLAAGAWEIEIEEIDKPFPNGTRITITQPKVSIYGGVDDVVGVYVGRVFRHFVKSEQVQILVNGVAVAGAEWDLETDTGIEKIDGDVNGKRVRGWIGFQRVFTPKGGYGIDLIRHNRVVRRHEKIGFGAHPKYNKIVGEVFLDDFEVVNNKTDFVRDTDDWRQFDDLMKKALKPLTLLASRKYGGDLAPKDKARVAGITNTFESALRSEEFARSLDRQLLSDALSDQLAPTPIEKRNRRTKQDEDEQPVKPDNVVEMTDANERRPRTPTETREVLRRTRTKLLDLNIEHVPVKFGPQSAYKTWDIDGLGESRRLVVSSNLDHPMFSFVNDTITWIKHNIAEAAAEYLSKEAGVEDMLKIKSDILRFVGELEVAEEEQEQDARVS